MIGIYTIISADTESAYRTIEGLIAQSEKISILDPSEKVLGPVMDAMSVAPQDPSVLCRGASILTRYGPALEMAQKIFERVLKIDPDYKTALLNLSWLMTSSGEYARAVEYGERLISNPNNHTPEDYFLAARAHRLNDNADRAAALLRDVIDMIPTSGPVPFLKPNVSLKPVAAYLGGWAEEAENTINEICRPRGKGKVLRDIDLYPEPIDERVRRLKEIVEGKDVYFYGSGPSLSEISGREDLLVRDDVVHFAINNFPIVEDDILKPFGARVMLTCLSHPNVVLMNSNRLRELLARPNPTMVLLNSFALDNCADIEEASYLQENERRIFQFRSEGKLPPTPRDPLNFPNINTFILSLCAVILGKPRRVFLFGFDQRIAGDDHEVDGALYYKETDDRYYASDRTDPSIRRHIRDWVKWDGIQVNEVSIVSLRMLAAMFELDLPLIYNVCPKSALEGFPKIDVERMSEIIRG